MSQDQLWAAAPDLIVTSWGLNDVRLGTTTLAQLIARHEQLITLIKTNLPNADIILRMPNSLTTTVVGTDFVDVITHQAASDMLRECYLYFVDRYPNVLVIDFMARTFGTVALPTSPFMLDELHPNGQGYTEIARIIAQTAAHTPVWAVGPKGNALAHRFRAVCKVSTAGNGFFDITPLPNASGDTSLSSVWPARWPIAPTDTIYFNGYGPLLLTGATFGSQTTTNIRISKTGDWTALLNQVGTIVHTRMPGVQDGRHLITVDPGSVAPGTYLDVTVTVPGASLQTGVICQPPTTMLTTGLMWNVMGSAVDTVILRLFNPTATAIDMASNARWHFWLAN